MEGTMAEVRMFAGNFAPLSWMFCQGQLLPIAQYDALFSLLGTTYGGDGQSTFGLPNLSSRIAKGTGQGPGLSNYVIGQMSGVESNTLTVNNIGNHGHTLSGTAGILVSSQDGHAATPVNNFPAINGDNIYSTTTDNSVMAPASVALTTAVQTGNGSTSISNIKPYLAMNFIICVEGIFPSRN